MIDSKIISTIWLLIIRITRNRRSLMLVGNMVYIIYTFLIPLIYYFSIRPSLRLFFSLVHGAHFVRSYVNAFIDFLFYCFLLTTTSHFLYFLIMLYLVVFYVLLSNFILFIYTYFFYFAKCFSIFFKLRTSVESFYLYGIDFSSS